MSPERPTTHQRCQVLTSLQSLGDKENNVDCTQTGHGLVAHGVMPQIMSQWDDGCLL